MKPHPLDVIGVALVWLAIVVVVAVTGCCPKRHTPCHVIHHPTGYVWQLEGPPVGHSQNPTIGLPGQWTPGYYHFGSRGSEQDREFGGVLKDPNAVSVPICESDVIFEAEP